MVKRAFDIVVSLCALLVLSPLFVLMALLIKIDSKGPVFFRQERMGLNGHVFRMLKFRTMIDGAQTMGSGIMTDAEDPRITRIGKYLRRASADELPQLVNVLIGEMSIVGPRPAPLIHAQKYGEWERRRLAVRPGITGWAQVNGRNNLTWPQRIEMDVWYVENQSLLLDLGIIVRTAKCVVLSQGVYSGRYKEKVREMNRAITR